MKTTGVQFFKFALIGGLNTIVHFCIFIICHRLFDIGIITATTIGYAAGMLNSFILNRIWTFKIHGHKYYGEFIKFILVNGISLLTNVVALKFLTEKFYLVPEIAQIGAILFSLVVNFSGNKWWTFRKALG